MIPAINPSSSVTLLLCLNEILVSTITRNDCRIFAINTNNKLSLPTFVINLKDESTVDKSQKPDIYLINLDEIILDHFIHIFYKHTFFNPRANYILFGTTIFPNISITLASEFIVNVIFLDIVSWKIFTYYPYINRMIWKTDNDWKEITSCNTIISSEQGSINFFEEKIPKIWTNSSVSLGLLYFPPYEICLDCEKKGYEIDLFDVVLARMNLTGIYKEADDLGMDVTLVGKHLLLNKEYDIFLCEIISSRTDFVYPYLNVLVYWVVPSSEELPRWKYIFKIVTEEVWMFWVGSLVVFLGVWTLADIYLLDTAHVLQKFCSIMKLSIEQPISVSSPHLTQNIVAILLLFHTFIMSAILKAGFPFLLSGFNFEKPIETIGDVMDNNLTIGINSYHFELAKSYFSENSEMLDYFQKHIIICDISGACLNRLITEKYMATIIEEEVLYYRENNYRDNMGRSLVRKMMPPILSSQLGSNMMKGHPLTEGVNRYFLYLDQHGLKKRIMSFYSEVEPLQLYFQIKSLTVKFIVFPVLILGLGISIALIIFCLEFTSILKTPQRVLLTDLR